MKRIKNYRDFNRSKKETQRNSDHENFRIIFEGLLTVEERIILEDQWGPLNESLWSDFVGFVEDGKLKIKTKADEVLADLGEKAKKLVDFTKIVGEQMGKSLGELIKNRMKECENLVRKQMGALNVIVEKIEKTSKKYLRKYVESLGKLLKYVLGGQMIEDLVEKIKNIISKVFAENPNESLYVVDNHDLILEDEGERKRFLQRIRDRIMQYPPFSWLPDFEDLIKKGMEFVKKLFNKFFSWLSGQNSLLNDFGMAFQFLFGLLESYILFRIVGSLEKFKNAVLGKPEKEKNDTETEEDDYAEETKAGIAVRDAIGINLKDVKTKSLEFAFTKIGFNPNVVLNSALTAADLALTGGLITLKYKSIKTLIEYLMAAIGIYQISAPLIQKLV